MSTHMGRAFLNSCLKVPIDPCNNCPAPNYNRPKMYLGRMTTMTTTTTTRTATRTPGSQRSKALKMKSQKKIEECDGDVRSLAKLYDSIPDYCDINHLPEDEFYSTLDSLRSSCRALKIHTPSNYCVLEQSSTTSSLSLHCLGKPEKTKKHKKKCKAEHKVRPPLPCLGIELPKHVQDICRLKSLNDVCAYEMKAFRKHLTEVEAELEQPKREVSSEKQQTHSLPQAEPEKRADSPKAKSKETVPVKPTNTSSLRESMRKSFSFNDIHSLNEFPISKATRQLHADIGTVKPPPSTQQSKYFSSKPETEVQSDQAPLEQSNSALPHIQVESPSSGTLSSKLSSTPSSQGHFRRRKKTKGKKSNSNSAQAPFTLFDLSIKKENIEQSSASPLHPVARPNLAATLRAEVSKKKLKELQNNCTYHDATPQVDWEVRKTPAWKSLSLNESHKAVLQIRLATRKAEQALQQKEYELNMELMRQRVKSAPLLLEGQTYWGPIVGKLTHNCQREGYRHACETQQQRHRRGRAPTSSRSGTTTMRRCQSKCNCSDMKSRFEVTQKIYAASEKSYSRNSTRLDGTRSPRKQSKPAVAKSKHDANTQNTARRSVNNNDSGDELSSYDRTLL